MLNVIYVAGASIGGVNRTYLAKTKVLTHLAELVQQRIVPFSRSHRGNPIFKGYLRRSARKICGHDGAHLRAGSFFLLVVAETQVATNNHFLRDDVSFARCGAARATERGFCTTDDQAGIKSDILVGVKLFVELIENARGLEYRATAHALLENLG